MIVIFCFEKISSLSFFSYREGQLCDIPPPQKIALSKQIKKSLVASALLFAFNSSSPLAAPGQSINNDYLKSDGDDYEFKTSFSSDQNFDSISLENFTPPNTNNQHAISVASKTGAVLTITGDTYIESYTDSPNSGDGTYAITAGSYHNKASGIIHLQGNIDINVEHEQGIDSKYGANAIYASYKNSTIYLGSNGTTTKIWVLDSKPDAISAKLGGQVIFNSTNNQIVGSFDLFSKDSTEGEYTSRVQATFSGPTAYWFGDDSSSQNLSFIGSMLDKNHGVLDVTFKDGAQWSYLGLGNPVETGTFLGTLEMACKKRISSIRLGNDGIINLADSVLLSFWDDIGLLDKLDDGNYDVVHDVVEIGDLKGNGGIFRLDLNAENKSLSDVVFIEGSSDPGTHSLEPYQLDKLESVTPENTLIFAFVDSSASAVKFTDKVNLEGESLFDYELTIDSSKITKEDLQAEEIKNKNIEGQSQNDYVDGTKWFIKRIKLIESAASIGMRSAGYASYDLAVNMDRHDRRLQNAVFQNEEKDGLWARVQYGEAGAEHLYNADLTTVYVGYEKATSADNRLGFSFAYTDGDSDFNDFKGTGELKRYEASVYDTLTFGSHYLDFVARFGQVDNEFDVTNQSGALTTTGSFDQKYAALSAEYGYNFKDEHNVFIEPQVQLQVAYLGDYNYRTERNMKVDADSDISVIGRVGLRTGKTFESSDYVGELYARADVLHQFTDGQDAQFSDLSDKVNVTWGNKDTWSTFGVGGYLNWKDNVSFQVDVERTAGGETIDTWLVSGRVNYLF